MRPLIVFLLVIVYIGSGAFAQNKTINNSHTPKKDRSEIMSYLAKLPEVSVTYLTKSMLQRLPKDKAGSPLAILADKGGVESIRVFQLGSEEAESGGKKLIDSYLSDISETNYAELIILHNNASNEVIMYGFPMYKDISFYHTVLMYSKSAGNKAILIILRGRIDENVIGELIDSFSTQNKAAM